MFFTLVSCQFESGAYRWRSHKPDSSQVHSAGFAEACQTRFEYNTGRKGWANKIGGKRVQKKTKGLREKRRPLNQTGRRPTLPHTCACSTIGAEELNCRVRDGNGWVLLARVTQKLVTIQTGFTGNYARPFGLNIDGLNGSQVASTHARVNSSILWSSRTGD